MNKIETTSFRKLLGSWKTEGVVLSDQSELKGTDTYELILDGNFILHKADVIMRGQRNETLEIIAIGDSGSATMSYYNSKGESGKMSAFIREEELVITGDRIKFNGILIENDSAITGQWFHQKDDGNWESFIKMKLTKEK